MPLQIAKDAADLLVKINKPKNITPSLTFFGGEPTLCWDTIIVPLVEYIKEKNYDFEFDMTSNCILLDEEKVKYMKDNNIGLLFSIDGAKETQDYNRPCHDCKKSSFDILEKKLPMIVENFPNTTFRSTVIPATCDHLYENILFAEEHGFKNCFACPNDFEEWTPEKRQILFSEVRKFTLHYIDAYKNNRDVIHFSPLEEKYQKIMRINSNARNNEIDKKTDQHCGLGVNWCAVNYEGKLFGCQELPSYGDDDDNLFYLGDIYKGINIKRQQNLIDQYLNNDVVCENKNRCKNCLLASICQNDCCPANAYLKNKNVYTASDIRCDWDQHLLNEAIFAMTVLGNNNNRKFISHFKNSIGWEE